MPLATIDVDPVRYDLKSVEGGYVVIRCMPFGAKQQRQEMALSDTRMKQTKGSNDQEIAVTLLRRIVSEFEFAQCIVEHNLEDRDGNLLNFKDPKVMDVLHPRIGEEIDGYISAENNFEDEDEKALGNSSIA